MNMTNNEYHGDNTRISKSGLDLIHKTPAHYYAAHLDPNRKPLSDEDAAKFFLDGTAAHAIVLEPRMFGESYIVRPSFSRTFGTSKAAEMFDSLSNGKTVLDLATYDMLQRMRDAVYAHPVAAALLRSGRAEQTIHWTDPTTGAPCKCRPDWDSDMDYIVDLKTTDDISPSGFARSSAKYRYFVQDPFYMDGIEIATGRRRNGFVLIAVEKKPPYQVEIYTHSEQDIELGRQQYLENLETYMECKRTGIWPAFKDRKVKTLVLPSYLTQKTTV